jgi:BirA family biotin operon repressor/biotin-[acetyl-CoA-carboxylase] ligase
MMKYGPLTKEAIQSTLTTRWLGRPIHYLAALPSTNDLLKELAEHGSPAGTMVLTDFQSKGKGRLNRRWETPPGSSLLVSLLFRPNWPAQQATWLTMIAGLAAVSAVQQATNLTPSLKWPNDLVLQVEGQWRKFGGLLLEGHFEGDRLGYAILGSGINVNIPPAALPEAVTPATNLSAVRGQPLNRLSLLNHYLLALERLYETAESGQSPQPAWVERLITLGQPVRVSGPTLAAAIEGTAVGVDEWGRLLVREENGRLHTLAAGDVSLRG